MRILIVDDEPQITRVLRTSMQSHGYEVEVAKDGVQAFKIFEQFAPDLVDHRSLHAEHGWRGADQGHPQS